MRLKDPTILLSTGEELILEQPKCFSTMYDITVLIVKTVYNHFETTERNVTRAQTKAAAELGYADPSSIRRILA